MFKVEKKLGEVPEYVLHGTVDEDVNLPDYLNNLEKVIKIDALNITKINSVGVKKWITFFNKLKEDGVDVSFSRVSIPLVEQMNSISNFIESSVEEIVAPYICSNPSCEKESHLPHRTHDLKTNLTNSISNKKCPHCNSELLFDDLEDEFFSFLEK